MTVFTELEKNHLKLHMELKESPQSQVNSKQKEQSGRHHITRLQTILEGYSNQNSMVPVPKQRDRPMERTEASEITPHIYNHLIYKNKQWGKDSLFNNGAVKTG